MELSHLIVTTVIFRAEGILFFFILSKLFIDTEPVYSVDLDEMVGWHHRGSGHEPGQTWGDGEVQGSLARCSPWGCEESDTTW